ncbi:hypothetical protein M440DRAFT_270778 [Trichoderma longibrachiatum ATCC 18648]|uniref:Uncharacterized protein n=1 Tax=Trichoderma longibrachiatum ATCC 18648 TaxID=983965 RepID=A0A2T4CBB1_TRILO|nr:hypothetical protein M440DRAFT_270778 [Trichoderma longibrachiatum ATCC 18648]
MRVYRAILQKAKAIPPIVSAATLSLELTYLLGLLFPWAEKDGFLGGRSLYI